MNVIELNGLRVVELQPKGCAPMLQFRGHPTERREVERLRNVLTEWLRDGH